jgi:ATP-dependent protease ClpP protease subunit
MEAAPQSELEEDDSYELVYVVFSANVDQRSAESLLAAMSSCANGGAREVRLLLSTFGGNVSAGINLYNVLCGLPFRLVTHNAGDVASIGLAVYLAGEERLTCANSSFLTHGVTNTPPPGQPFGAKWFSDTHTAILEDESRINAILAERTSLTADQLAASSERSRSTTLRVPSPPASHIG